MASVTRKEKTEKRKEVARIQRYAEEAARKAISPSGAKIYVSDTAPTNPSENDLWVDIS
jgi:hypothetical protein